MKCSLFNVIIISLRGPSPRKKFQEEQMAKLGLNARFLDASTPENLPFGILEKFTSAWARPLRSTEVALTHSHILAWKQTIKAGKPTLILEDDAILCTSIGNILHKLSSNEDLELVQLETFNAPKLLGSRRESLQLGEYELRSLYRDRGGAAAYLLWPQAAESLIKSIRYNYPPADAAIHLAPGIKRHQVIPACAIQAMNLSPQHPMYARVVGIASSSVSCIPRPRYVSKRQWLKHKLRRLKISFTLFKRKLFAMQDGTQVKVEFSGD
jgi:glycosyl transferase family 25